MANFDRATMQRAISSTYKSSDLYIPSAIAKLDEMIQVLASLEPASALDLKHGAQLVVEDFASHERH
jgi:hypothetical protein